MKSQHKDQKILLQLKEQIKDPADSFFLGLTLKKEQKNHKSMSECLEYLKDLIIKVNDKERQLKKQDDPYWKLQIYYDYLQQIDTHTTCYEFLKKYIDLPNDQVKIASSLKYNKITFNIQLQQDEESNWNTEQTESNDRSYHSFQVKKQRQNTFSSRNNKSGHYSPTFNNNRDKQIAQELQFAPEITQNEQEKHHEKHEEKQHQIDHQQQTEQQQPQHYQEVEPQVCCKCENKIHHTDILQLSCEHSYHINCFKKEMNKLLEQEIFPIKCLEKDCINIPSMDSLTGNVLDKKTYPLYQNCFEQYHTNQGRIIKCPNQNCRQKMLCGKPREQYASCVFCSQEICLICYRIRHNGLDCEQVLMSNPKEIEEMVQQNKQKMNKQCPKCKIIHKNQDCQDVLKCICGMKFCATCNKESPKQCNCSKNKQGFQSTSNNTNTSMNPYRISYSQSKQPQAQSQEKQNQQDYSAQRTKSNQRMRSTDHSKKNLRSMNTTQSQFEKQNTSNNPTNPSSPFLFNEQNPQYQQKSNLSNNQRPQSQQYNNLSQSRDFNTENNTNNLSISGNYNPDTTITRYDDTSNNRLTSPPFTQTQHQYNKQQNTGSGNQNPRQQQQQQQQYQYAQNNSNIYQNNNDQQFKNNNDQYGQNNGRQNETNKYNSMSQDSKRINTPPYSQTHQNYQQNNNQQYQQQQNQKNQNNNNDNFVGQKNNNGNLNKNFNNVNNQQPSNQNYMRQNEDQNFENKRRSSQSQTQQNPNQTNQASTTNNKNQNDINSNNEKQNNNAHNLQLQEKAADKNQNNTKNQNDNNPNNEKKNQNGANNNSQSQQANDKNQNFNKNQNDNNPHNEKPNQNSNSNNNHSSNPQSNQNNLKQNQNNNITHSNNNNSNNNPSQNNSSNGNNNPRSQDQNEHPSNIQKNGKTENTNNQIYNQPQSSQPQENSHENHRYNPEVQQKNGNQRAKSLNNNVYNTNTNNSFGDSNQKQQDHQHQQNFENHSATFTPIEQQRQYQPEQTPSHKRQNLVLQNHQDVDHSNDNVTFAGDRHIPKVKESDAPLLSSRSVRHSHGGGGVVPMVPAQPQQQNNQGTPYKSLQFSKYNLPKLSGNSSQKRGAFLQNSFTNQQQNEHFENNLSHRSNNTQMQRSIFDDENQPNEDTLKDHSYLADSRYKPGNSQLGSSATTPRRSSQQERKQTPSKGVSPYRQQQQQSQNYSSQKDPQYSQNNTPHSSAQKEQQQKIKV